MARVLTKKSTVAAKVPLATDLEIGELAVNTADAKLYTKHSDNTVKQLGIATSDSRLTDAREWTASTVSQAEAEAGTATTRRAWTAQRVFQAVAAWWAASADKTKLDGIQAGAQVNVGTNLAQGARTTTAVPVTSSTGTGATLGAATTSLAGVMTAADKTKLDGVATGATANASDAQLRDRATHTGSQAISTVTGLQAALDNKINTSERGVSGGIATLDATARIPASQLPSYVDDVLEYATTAQFPATGETGKIYIAINQGTAANPTRQYRWTGTVYAEINPSPGTTDALAEGSTNLYFSEHRVRNTLLTGLSLAVSTAVTAADSVLSAIGKLQAQFGLKADLASPTFTGDPKAPTPASTDNDNSIATTAFVRAAMGLFGLGGQGTANVTSLNEITTPGLWSTLGSGLTEVPPGFSSGRIMVMFWGSTTYGAQVAIEASSANATAAAALMAFRRVRGGVWSEWVVNWHTGNLVKQTSATDTTAGALMAVGAFGSAGGTTNVNFPGTSVDDHTVANGTYRVFRAATPNGTHPPGVSGDYMLTVLGRYSATHVAQIAQFYVNGVFRLWTRQVNSGFGSPWTELFHEGNFNPATKQDKSAVVGTATTRTLALTDAWNYLRPNTTGAITLTVPTNTSVAFEIGTEITIRALGNVTLAAASGVTLNAPSGGTLNMTARMTVTLKKVGTNEWDVIGQTVAA